MRPSRRSAVLAALSLAVVPATAGPPPSAQLILEVTSVAIPGHIPEAAPPRFVMLEDGTVFIGGSSRLLSGRPDKAALREIEAQVERVRKLPGLGAQVSFGAGPARYRLVLPKGLAINAVGDRLEASAAQKPLADLLDALLRFDDPGLREYRPAQYAVSAREVRLEGGCRSWTLPVPLAEALQSPRAVAADAAADWPMGSTAASVCAGGKTYAVSLKPLLPTERP